MKILKSIGITIWSVVLFAAGVFFAFKIKKPETVVNNHYDKVKTKGENNQTSTEAKTDIVNDNKKVKKKFRLFRKKN